MIGVSDAFQLDHPEASAGGHGEGLGIVLHVLECRIFTAKGARRVGVRRCVWATGPRQTDRSGGASGSARCAEKFGSAGGGALWAQDSVSVA